MIKNLSIKVPSSGMDWAGVAQFDRGGPARITLAYRY